MNKFWDLIFNWYTYWILFVVGIVVFNIFLPGSSWVLLMMIPMGTVAAGIYVRETTPAYMK